MVEAFVKACHVFLANILQRTQQLFYIVKSRKQLTEIFGIFDSHAPLKRIIFIIKGKDNRRLQRFRHTAVFIGNGRIAARIIDLVK